MEEEIEDIPGKYQITMNLITLDLHSSNNLSVPINNELERRIADAFEIFDHGGNKTIDVREVGTVVRALGCCPSEAEVQEILVAIEDPAFPGSVHLSKFLPHVAQLITEHKLV